ncbi:MAG: DUF4253 domain-containing protein [Acidobacteriota bacterium]
MLSLHAPARLRLAIVAALLGAACSPLGFPELPPLEPLPRTAVEPVDGETLRSLLTEADIATDDLRLLHQDPEGETWRLVVPGQDGLTTWAMLRDLVDRTGRWPVFLGDAAQLPEMQELAKLEPRPVAELLRSARTLDVSAWLEARRRDPSRTPAPPGRWSGAPSEIITSTHDVLSMEPLDRVVIALIPTPRSWEAPAWIRFGGFNECPRPDEQAAIFRRWARRHGVEVVALSWDIAELAVLEPVETREGALALAQEQFLYCPDVVHQGTESLKGLAATIQDARVWSFWWD